MFRRNEMTVHGCTGARRRRSRGYDRRHNTSGLVHSSVGTHIASFSFALAPSLSLFHLPFSLLLSLFFFLSHFSAFSFFIGTTRPAAKARTRQGDLLGKTSSSTQSWTRFLLPLFFFYTHTYIPTFSLSHSLSLSLVVSHSLYTTLRFQFRLSINNILLFLILLSAICRTSYLFLSYTYHHNLFSSTHLR